MFPKFAILLILSICIHANILGSNNYSVGDHLYVWSLNGLKLRVAASASSDIKNIVKYKDKIRVLSKSDAKYNLTILDRIDNSSPEYAGKPIILKGNWVQIVSEANDTGYVIDQYLLPLKPQKSNGHSNIFQELKITKFDTLYQKDGDGEALMLKIKYKFEKNITCVMQQGGVWTNVSYTFGKFTMNEALIIFSAVYSNFEGMSISQNIKDRIEIVDGVMCRFILTNKNGVITLEELCAC